jgi:hypothetical protein
MTLTGRLQPMSPLLPGCGVRNPHVQLWQLTCLHRHTLPGSPPSSCPDIFGCYDAAWQLSRPHKAKIVPRCRAGKPAKKRDRTGRGCLPLSSLFISLPLPRFSPRSTAIATTFSKHSAPCLCSEMVSSFPLPPLAWPRCPPPSMIFGLTLLHASKGSCDN